MDEPRCVHDDYKLGYMRDSVSIVEYPRYSDFEYTELDVSQQTINYKEHNVLCFSI